MTEEAGIVDRDGRGLGVVAADLDGDGKIDLFVANDTTANYFFRNRGGFRFAEQGLESGLATSAGGGYLAGMGVACGDFDGDGRLDLAVTNFFGESTTLYHNHGGGIFSDRSAAAGLAAPTRFVLGFGLAALDANNDGRLDLAQANGHVDDYRPDDPLRDARAALPGRRRGQARSTSRTAPGRPGKSPGWGADWPSATSTTTAASTCSSSPRTPRWPCFTIRPRPQNHFLMLALEGTTSNRDAVGARVAVTARGGPRSPCGSAEAAISRRATPVFTSAWDRPGRSIASRSHGPRAAATAIKASRRTPGTGCARGTRPPSPLPASRHALRYRRRSEFPRELKTAGGSMASEDDLVRKTSQWSAVFCCTIAGVVAVISGCDTAATDRTGNDRGSAPSAGSPLATSGPELGAAPSAAKPRIVGDRRDDDVDGPDVLSTQTEPSPFRFAEIARDAGIDFVHFSGMTAEKHFPTANGSGVAIFDYDNDGKLDLYFATATLLPLGTAKKGPNRLFKNLGGNKFQDVTESAGVGFAGFCHGIVVGDIDNDGDPDVFLCNYGANVLYLNNGDGTFRDISKSAGIDRPNWSSGGAFLDYDNDGDLDLYVANYGNWKLPEDDKFCGRLEPKRLRLYCSPNTIRPAKHLLYRNNGDLTFTDVYDQAILTIDPETKKPKPRSDGRGFAAVTADLNGDGLIDIYVANDMNPNFLFLNRGDGTFEDATESSGAAYDEKGQAQSGMGVDAEDVNGDGLPDLFVTNFANEYNTLYINLASGLFMDATPFFGLAADTMPFVGWGTALADFDNDGWPDNFVANGHVDDNRRELGQHYDYAEPPLSSST